MFAIVTGPAYRLPFTTRGFMTPPMRQQVFFRDGTFVYETYPRIYHLPDLDPNMELVGANDNRRKAHA
jgi:hypothetical protein